MQVESVRTTRRCDRQHTERKVRDLIMANTSVTHPCSHKQGARPKHAKKGTPEYSLIESIHASEKHVLGEQCSAHTFEVSINSAYRRH